MKRIFKSKLRGRANIFARPNTDFRLMAWLAIALLLSESVHAMAATPKPLEHLSDYRSTILDIINLVKTKEWLGASVEMQKLSDTWDETENQLKSSNPETWKLIDHAIASASRAVEADNPDTKTSERELTSLLKYVDKNSLK